MQYVSLVRVSRAAAVAVCVAAALIRTAQAQPQRTFRVAFYNIQSGKGEIPLPGISCPFLENSNCTDATQPLNAWGLGLVQQELVDKIGSDPQVLALGLAEAWACANPKAVQTALGWAARTSERNGVALIARYGFAGPEEWLQLDTSRNTSPTDTKWVVRAPVCTDAGCTGSVMVHATHMSADTMVTADSYAVAEYQAQQTIDFMNTAPAGDPRVIVGDFNVFEGTQVVCSQNPRNRPLAMLRAAGYLDAWPAVRGLAEGFTGMWNRPGCGSPEGYLWKRIDYAWSRNLNPLAISRFGMVTPGQCALSDHAGIIAEYPLPGAGGDAIPPTVAILTPAEGAAVADTVAINADVHDDVAVARVELLIDGIVAGVSTAAPFGFTWNARTVPNGPHIVTLAVSDVAGNRTTSPPRSISVENPIEPFDETVLHAVDAVTVAGKWTLAPESTAAAGQMLQTADQGLTNGYAAMTPSTYADFSFYAVAGRPYRLWLRGRAQNNRTDNDSVYVQFDHSVDASGQPRYRIGTIQQTTVQFEECDGCGLEGWAWADNGVPRDVLGPPIYFDTSGQQKLRLQVKEDGVEIDQVVISAVRYLLVPPGRVKNDDTVLPSTASGPGTPSNLAPTVSLTSPAAGTTLVAPAEVALTAVADDADGSVARVDFYAGSTPIGSATGAPFTTTWHNVAAGSYSLTARAIDNLGTAGVSTAVALQVTSAPPPPGSISEIVVHAATASAIVGNWQLTADTTAASGIRVQNADLSAAKVTVPATAPAHAFELTFQAQAGIGYHLWLRMKALNDYYGNDSVYVQFDGSVDAGGLPISRLGTTAAETVILEDCSGCGVQGWGWNDNGYGVQGRPIYFAATGPQRMRVQSREDGLGIDQVVLSAVQYATAAPGTLKNDTTILAATGAGPNPPPVNVPPGVTLTQPAVGATFLAPASISLAAAAADSDGSIVRVEFYAGSTLIASSSTSPYTAAWGASTTGSYSLTARAIDNGGATATSAPVTVTVSAPPVGSNGEIVLHTAAATGIVGNWQLVPDLTAASGLRMQNADLNAPKVTVASAAPAHAFDLTFEAQAGIPYHLWMRMKALNDSYGNDSVYVQFDGTVDAGGAAISRIGTTSAETVILEECSGCGVQGWGWQDNGYGVPGKLIYFAMTGPQRLRIQVREDGLGVDQIVLSAVTYASAAPGSLKNDTTILPSTVAPPPPANLAPSVSLDSPNANAAFTAPASVSLAATANDSDGAVARVEFYAGASLIGSVVAPPYAMTWTNVVAGSYTLTARAIDSASASTTSAPVAIVVNPPVNPPPSTSRDELVLYTAAAVNIKGTWTLTADASAAAGMRIQNANLRTAKANVAADPPNSFELVFEADAGKPYYLWLRGVALNNDLLNDSVYVQFDGSVDSAGKAINRIGSKSAQTFILENCTGCGIRGWGWTDNASNAAGVPIYFATSGPQRLRVQPREDGLGIDQIVLSTAKYKTTAPGTAKDDVVILPRTN
jgi:hypothetical protein